MTRARLSLNCPTVIPKFIQQGTETRVMMNIQSTVTVRHRFFAHWKTVLSGFDNPLLSPRATNKLLWSLWRMRRSTHETRKRKDLRGRRDILSPVWLKLVDFAIFADSAGVENLVADLPPAAAFAVSNWIETRVSAIFNQARGTGDLI